MAESKPTNSKSKEELEAEQAAAKEQLNALLNASRPKHVGYGVAAGVSNVVSGAVGGVGLAVMAPTLGLAQGAKHGGIVGGTIGLVGGALVGAIGGAAVIVSGAVGGVTQVVRGIAATPDAIIEPRRGKWWNDNEGKWIMTNLEDELKEMANIPEDDDDILGEAKKEADSRTADSVTASNVVDLTYYQALDVDVDAEPSKIKRQYYLLAKKYHPDKVGTDNKEAADRFKEISEAYQVLSDIELRKKYDAEGKSGLSADRTGVNDGPGKVDPAMLFAFLFGSDKFGDYFGRLAMATSALVADSPKIGPKEARTVQKRRVTRLAFKLAERVSPYIRLEMWVSEDYEMAKAMYESAAMDLSKASYGTELVHLIGKVYSLSAHQFLGSTDSGMGMPSIAKWAKGHYAQLEKSKDANKAKRDGLVAGVKMMTMQQKVAQDIAAAKTEEERKVAERAMEEEMTKGMLHMMWTTSVVDITTTLHEVAQMVLYDQSVNKDVRKRRVYGLKNLGEIFMACPAPLEAGTENAKNLYEEAAFAAMLETIKRKEEEAQAAPVP
eukprot:CCRYP_003628-RB/>CCRYP_003628-RB protein AED:0.09 eAED:0.09 QI:165/0.83/0.85/1/0.66/0.57/7/1472/550